MLDLPLELMIGCHMRPAASKRAFSVARNTAHGSRIAKDSLGAGAVRLQNMSRVTNEDEHIFIRCSRPRLGRVMVRTNVTSDLIQTSYARVGRVRLLNLPVSILGRH